MKHVDPVFPLHQPGRPIIYYSLTVFGVVGRDGDLQNLVVQDSDKSAGDAALNALHQWRFEPFTVCGNPLEMPVNIKVNTN